MTDKIDTSGRAPAPVVSGEGEQPLQPGLARATAIVAFAALAFVPAVRLFRISSASYTPWSSRPRATVLGTIATAVVYTLSLTVVFVIVPTSTLACTTEAR